MRNPPQKQTQAPAASTCISFVTFEHNGKDEPETEVQLNLNYKLELKEKKPSGRGSFLLSSHIEYLTS